MYASPTPKEGEVSYNVDLVDKEGNILQMEEAIEEGGTYIQGGTTECSLNVTYNYSQVYHLLGWRLGMLNGYTAEETKPKLEELVEKLGTNTFGDYWAPTPGNAGHALSILLRFAKAHPEGRWEVH